ncbi:hypothetical protein Nmel_003530, partial [Mimus melanotis]
MHGGRKNSPQSYLSHRPARSREQSEGGGSCSLPEKCEVRKDGLPGRASHGEFRLPASSCPSVLHGVWAEPARSGPRELLLPKGQGAAVWCPLR